MKRYVVCGLSNRSVSHFLQPLLGANGDGPNFKSQSQIVGIHDIDEARVAEYNRRMGTKIPFFKNLDQMLRTTRPDIALVAGPDYTHGVHIVKALRAGANVISEKPMVISAKEVLAIQKAEKESGKRVTVAFNYRYSPLNRTIKKLVQEGAIGRVTNVELTWNLDTFHGSSYFYRWNRKREFSGGLSIHKCCHHFDLVNWWLGDTPEEVHAFGALNYYGPKGAHNPGKGKVLSVAETKQKCPYAQRWLKTNGAKIKDDHLSTMMHQGLPYAAQYPDQANRYIYDKEINVEDTYSVLVRFKTGASLAYSCNFSTPWEGYQLGINGTEGRIEGFHYTEASRLPFTIDEHDGLFYTPLFGKRTAVKLPQGAGGHGGADYKIQNDLFGKIDPESKKLGLIAGSREGGYAVATGEAVWKSVTGKKTISVPKLLKLR